MTRYEKIINGNKKDMVSEFVSAIKWARTLPASDWSNIVNGWPGLEGLVCEVLDQEVE
jgi:hypothetical protein